MGEHKPSSSAGNLAHLIKDSIYSENKNLMSCLRCSASFLHDLFYIVRRVALGLFWLAETER